MAALARVNFATQVAPKRAVRANAADRPMWLPGTKAPAHLNGQLAGDFGFDPLGLGSNADNLKWYAEAERMNARVAMVGVAGILFTEATGVAPKWFETGAQDFGTPLQPLIAIEAVIFGFLETKRFQGWKETGVSGVLNSFPFDPAGMNSPSMALKEIKNGRLAMIAFFGFSVQAMLTGEGPIEGLLSHMESPFDHNITSNIVNNAQFH